MNFGYISDFSNTAVGINVSASFKFTNSCCVDGSLCGFFQAGAAAGRFINTGDLSGSFQSPHFGAGNDKLANHGTLSGDVMQGLGADFCDGRGGVQDVIFGSVGNDTIHGGLSAVSFIFGRGNDADLVLDLSDYGGGTIFLSLFMRAQMTAADVTS